MMSASQAGIDGLTIDDHELAERIALANPSSRREQILHAIRSAIVTGEFPPGMQLKQDELAARFNSSPGPVREALRQLVSEGLIQHHPNRGAFVTEVALDELLEVLLPMRVVAETYAMRKVARPSLSPFLLKRFQEQVAAMERGAAEGDTGAVIEADVRFHQIAVLACGSSHVTQLWESVESRVRVLLYRLAPQHQSLDEIATEHQQLLDAMCSANPTLISTVVECHILGAASTLLASQIAQTS